MIQHELGHALGLPHASVDYDNNGRCDGGAASLLLVCTYSRQRVPCVNLKCVPSLLCCLDVGGAIHPPPHRDGPDDYSDPMSANPSRLFVRLNALMRLKLGWLDPTAQVGMEGGGRRGPAAS